MLANQITANTPTGSIIIDSTRSFLALDGAFDSASVAVEIDINGTWYPLLDSTPTAIAFTADVNYELPVSVGDRIRLNPTGGLGSQAIDWKVSGASKDRG